jgi:pimeloyl-ACP methyl ester carboxylesterase
MRISPALLIVGAGRLLGCRDPHRVLAAAPPPPVPSDVVDSQPASPAFLDASQPSPEPPRDIGPFHVPFLNGRTALVVLPAARSKPHRLIATLHGVCNPPSYACGSWKEAASTFGLLVCPTGNTTCTTEAPGAPTWEEPFAQIDADLEQAIAKVAARYPGEIAREGAILTGFSRGAYAAAIIAARHPGRWPMLVLNEADTELSLTMLRSAKVRAVALIAGEWGSQIAGERKNADDLAAQGFPIRLWVMPKAGHFYSANIDDIMRQAIEFVLAHEHDA